MAATIENRLAIRTNQRRRPTPGSAVRFVLLLVFLIIVLLPVYVLVVSSFKAPGDATASNAWSLPTTWVLDNWKNAWSGGATIPAQAPGVLRSLALVVPASVISAFLGSMNGYVFAKWRFPHSNLVFTFLLFGMFIPYQAVMVPLLEFLPMTGLARGVPQLLAVHVIYGIPICTLIFRNYYQTIVPMELIEAGRVDGAGLLRTFRSLILPLSLPGFVVTMIWQFTSVWNDYLFAVFLSSRDNGPVILGLANLAGSQIVPYPEVFAGALIVTAPTLLVYIVLGRWFVGGLMAGAVKS